MSRHMLCRLFLLSTLAAAVPLVAEARDVEGACERAARDNGYRVVDFGRERELYSGEKLSGYAMQLRVRRDGEERSASCVYRIATGGASIIKVEGGRRDDRDEGDIRVPTEHESWNACVRAIKDRDFRLGDEILRRNQKDDRRRSVARLHVFEATRDRREWRVECVYDFRSRRAKTDYYRP